MVLTVPTEGAFVGKGMKAIKGAELDLMTAGKEKGIISRLGSVTGCPIIHGPFYSKHHYILTDDHCRSND